MKTDDDKFTKGILTIILYCSLVISGITELIAAEEPFPSMPELKRDADELISSLLIIGISDSDSLFEALKVAKDSAREPEYAALRELGITLSDKEFDNSWQNQPGRSNDFGDFDDWVTDAMRSWSLLRPVDAFKWMYATRDKFDYSFPRQPYIRMMRNLAMVNREVTLAMALSLENGMLRDEALTGIGERDILDDNISKAYELMPQITNDRLIRQLERLIERLGE